MNKFEVINYTSTPDEERSLGVVSVKINVPTVIYFQNWKKKDGSGYFWSSPGVKVPTEDGDKYVSPMPDSNTDCQELLSYIRAYMKTYHTTQQDVF